MWNQSMFCQVDTYKLDIDTCTSSTKIITENWTDNRVIIIYLFRSQMIKPALIPCNITIIVFCKCINSLV